MRGRAAILGSLADEVHAPRPRGGAGRARGLCYKRRSAAEALLTLDTFYPTPLGELPISAMVMIGVLLIVSLGAHEAAHAWVALRCGDSTGRDLGRITLNPIPHIDPMMTIVLPAVMMMTLGVFFGGAKPVPVNFYNLRRPYRDMAFVALAGPLTNVLCAAVLFAGFHYAWGYGDHEGKTLPQILYYAMAFNLLLAAFNLVPIPPLDGSRVMAWILPKALRPSYHALERFGLLIVIGLFFFFPGLIWPLVWRTIDAMQIAIEWIVTLGGLW